MSTPHQIRAGLLLQAQEILENQSRAKNNQGRGQVFPYGVDVITTDQIIAEAQKLNDFVSAAPAKTVPDATTPNQLRGTESRPVTNVIVKIGGLPFLLINGNLASHPGNWDAAGFKKF